MNIHIRNPYQHVSVVVPEGRVDAVSGPKLRRVLQRQPSREAPFLIVDLQNVTFMDSSGLSALVAGLKSARQHQGTVVLVGPSPQVRTTLELSMLDRIFPVYDTLEEALEAITPFVTALV